jgi:hypothetical protein
MGAIRYYKHTNLYNRWPVTWDLTGRKRIKAATSLRPFSINSKTGMWHSNLNIMDQLQAQEIPWCSPVLSYLYHFLTLFITYSVTTKIHISELLSNYQLAHWFWMLPSHDPLRQQYYQQQNLMLYSHWSSKERGSSPFQIYWHCLYPYSWHLCRPKVWRFHSWYVTCSWLKSFFIEHQTMVWRRRWYSILCSTLWNDCHWFWEWWVTNLQHFTTIHYSIW